MRYLSLFSGIGGFEVALHKVFPEAECIGYSEVDKYAIQIYSKHFPNHKNLGDITKIDPHSLPDFDMIFGGFPCFVAGTQIYTEQGYKPIEDITVGDMVLTHNKKYKAVEKISHKSNKTYVVKMQGALPIKTTREHPFYVREMKRVWNNGRRCYERKFGEPLWKEVKDMGKGDFVGIPILPENPNHKNSVDIVDAWLLGRYVADGYIRDGKRSGRKNSYNHIVTFCVGKKKRELFIKQSKYHIGCVEERTAYKLRIVNEEFQKKALQCGKGAKNKVIPPFIMNGSKEIAKSFLDGYLSGDGCYTNDKYKATTTSKQLAMGLCLLVAKIYNIAPSIHICQRPPKTKIEGRIANQNNTYEIYFQKETRKQNKQWTDGEYIWLPVKEIEEAGEDTVYNMQVAEDHTYLANNIVVHNCQDLSVAKKNREGLKGERSGLFWDMMEIVRIKQPKWFLFENVASMPKEDLGIISEAIYDATGYSNTLFGYCEPVMVNAALVSAQNRERLFWCNWHVEQPKDRGILLRDILEDRCNIEPEDPKWVEWFNSESGQKRLDKGFISINPDKASTLKARDYANWGGNFIRERKSYIISKKHEDAMRKANKNFKTRDPDGKTTAITSTYYKTPLDGNYISVPKSYMLDEDKTVIKRKHTVDKDNLSATLRKHKKLSNKEIAFLLQQPITTVEHWFRTDSSFSIPDPSIWPRLKDLLNIGTDEFDAPIMEFIEVPAQYDQSKRVYCGDKSPTIQTGTVPVIVDESNKNVMGEYILTEEQKEKMSKLKGKKTFRSGKGEGSVEFPMRTDRKSLTVLTSEGTISRTTNAINDGSYIRKLTPIECERLQSFDDDHTAEGIDSNGNIVKISNTQRYKTLGNAVNTEVIRHIFGELKKEI